MYDDEMNILVCEDDPGIQDLMEIMLEDMNFDVIKCDNQESVKELMSTEKVDIVIMDYWLSDGKADDVIIETKKKYPEVPILVVSADTNLDEVVKKLEVNDYLKKPFDIIEFQSKIKQLSDGTNNSSN
ncbi:response regulator [Candidatus Dojkabacteria bacterium]|jgi:DNA-binding response OmpR family regulator|uniref:Response regulator n=1 Tax=Candidatus Dojkabacteria bacterium TaxID=2099670 RepID=A0A955IBK4_9BACT|nr:response regulator [Candidatus Dojkabacteria bacterium]